MVDEMEVVDNLLGEDQKDRTGYKNMFTKVLGPAYARMFNQVYNATLANRDEKMMDLYDKAKEDPTLNAAQKKIMH